MFVARGIALPSRSWFCFTLLSPSGCLDGGWELRFRRFSAQVKADFLFGLTDHAACVIGSRRPLCSRCRRSCVWSLHSIDEPMGAIPLALSSCGVLSL